MIMFKSTHNEVVANLYMKLEEQITKVKELEEALDIKQRTITYYKTINNNCIEDLKEAEKRLDSIVLDNSYIGPINAVEPSIPTWMHLHGEFEFEVLDEFS